LFLVILIKGKTMDIERSNQLKKQKTLTPANPSTVLGKIYSSLMAKLAVVNLYDYFIGYERFPNQIKCYFSGSADMDVIEKLVDMYSSTPSKEVSDDGSDEYIVGVKWYTGTFEDEDVYIIELYCEQLESEEEEDMVPSLVDLEGDIEAKTGGKEEGEEESSEDEEDDGKVDVSKVKEIGVKEEPFDEPEDEEEEEPEDEEHKMKKKKEDIFVVCTGCGKPLKESELSFDVKEITEDAKLVCPVCKSEMTISALLTKAGSAGDEGLGLNLSPSEPSKPTAGGGAPPAPGGEGGGAPEGGEEFQIGLESTTENIANLLELMNNGTITVDEVFKKLTEAEDKLDIEWKGSLGDFILKLMGVVKDLNIPFEKISDFTNILTDSKVLKIDAKELKFDITDKTVGLISDFIQERKEKAFEPDPTLPDKPEPKPETDTEPKPEDTESPDEALPPEKVVEPGAEPPLPPPSKGLPEPEPSPFDAPPGDDVEPMPEPTMESVRDEVLQKQADLEEVIVKTLKRYFA